MAVGWYYKVMGQEVGPLPASQLRELATSGFLTPDVSVRQGEEGEWLPAGEVRGLFGEAPRAADERPQRPAPPAASAPEPAPADDRSAPSDEALPEPPPSQPQAAQTSWYCQAMGKEIGPLSPTALKELAASGFLSPSVLVRKGVDGEWVPSDRVKGLFDGPPRAPAGRPIKSPPPPPDPARKPAPVDTPADSQEGPSAKRSASEAPSPDTGWYCKVLGEETGPLSSSQLKELADSEFITPDVPVRKGADGAWLPAGRIKGLFDRSGRPAADEDIQDPPPLYAPGATPPRAEKASRAADKAPAGPSPARAQAAHASWYCKGLGDDNRAFSAQRLKEMARSGLLAPNTLVRKGIEGKWVPARQVKGLFDKPARRAGAKESRRPAAPAPAPTKPPRKPAVKPRPKPVVQPPPTPAPTPAPVSGFADFLDEAMAEPTPSLRQSSDIYATAPVTPRQRPPTFDPRTTPIYSPTARRRTARRSAAQSGGVLAGMGMMIGAVLWFFAGLAVGIIFFYPPVLFIIGLGVFFKGIFTAFAGGED